jgi:hypothetical protein
MGWMGGIGTGNVLPSD